jgi:hypothetical protein
LRHGRRASAWLLFSGLLLFAVVTAGRALAEKADTGNQPFVEVHLRNLGYVYEKNIRIKGNGIPQDLSLLNDDVNLRMTFIGEKTLSVYVSRFQSQPQQDGSPGSRSIEAFFIDTTSGALVAHKTWPTRKRRWLNNRWDTEARILALDDGYLVHAGGKLTLYSADFKERTSLPLDERSIWAVTVTPAGRVFHLQRISGGQDQAEGEWLSSDSLERLRGQHEEAGITSASEHAVVTALSHCEQLQAIGESPRDLCCSDECRASHPEFISENEVLLFCRNGFRMLSINGEELWKVETAKNIKNGAVADHELSLNGNRFAIALNGDRGAIFDQIKVPNGHSVVAVYDVLRRAPVFQTMIRGYSFDFALSPDGRMLAVLIGDTVRLYKIPS